MSVEELLEQLLSRLRDPRQLFAYAWIAWWLWSALRGKRKPPGAEQEQPQQQQQPAKRARRAVPRTRTRPQTPMQQPGARTWPRPERSPAPLPRGEAGIEPQVLLETDPLWSAEASVVESGPVPRRPAPAFAPPPARARARARPSQSLHAALRDRKTLRAAIVLGAAFERPRSQRS